MNCHVSRKLGIKPLLAGLVAGFSLGVLAMPYLPIKPKAHTEAQQIDSSEEATNLYPTVPVADIAAGKWKRPRATITGTVEGSHIEADGDRHFRVTDGKAFVVCEIVPELPLPHPKDGDKVTVKGIVRQDGFHGGWWELHPVISIR